MWLRRSPCKLSCCDTQEHNTVIWYLNLALQQTSTIKISVILYPAVILSENNLAISGYLVDTIMNSLWLSFSLWSLLNSISLLLVFGCRF